MSKSPIGGGGTVVTPTLDSELDRVGGATLDSEVDRVGGAALDLLTDLVETHDLVRPTDGVTNRPAPSNTGASADAWRAFDLCNAADALADLYHMEDGVGLTTVAKALVTSGDRILATLRARESRR